MKEVRKFSIRDEVGYVFGDMAGSFVNLFVDAYFLVFCTYALGIDAKWMGTLFIAARLWDAINDPIIGSFPDRWQIGKSGDKFKPYIKIFMIPLALSGVLCFTDASAWNLSSFALHAWVAFVYVLFGMSYTGTSMPFGAMASVISDDPVDRTKLSRARSIGGGVIGVVVAAVPPVFCFADGNVMVPGRFTILAVIFGVCCLISYTLLNQLTIERIRQPKMKKEKFNYGKVLKNVLHNRPLLGVMFATLGSMLYITGASQLGTYIYKEYYHNTDVMALVNVASLPLMLILLPVVPRLVEKFGKRKVVVGFSVFGLGVFGLLLAVPISNVYVYGILSVLGMFGTSGFAMLIWAMVTDCLDYTEWKTGERNDGSMYSIYTFSRKIGSTLASALAAFGLDAIGFQSGLNVVQTADTVNNIRILVCVIPVITCALQIIGVGFIYNLDDAKTKKMYKELAKRRAEMKEE